MVRFALEHPEFATVTNWCLMTLDAHGVYEKLGFKAITDPGCKTERWMAMIRAKHFAMMKPGAIFINTARGRIVVEKDLVEALRSERLAGAGLDVFETEPLPADSPLRLLPNVVLTPHAAGITREATEAGLAMAIGNVLAFKAGTPMHVVS